MHTFGAVKSMVSADQEEVVWTERLQDRLFYSATFDRKVDVGQLRCRAQRMLSYVSGTYWHEGPCARSTCCVPPRRFPRVGAGARRPYWWSRDFAAAAAS